MRSKPIFLCLASILLAHIVVAKVDPHLSSDNIRIFDEYERIAWEDEKARLDNFAISLTNEPDLIGFIFVINSREVCPGEAQARAVRAKRYIVEHRGVPWNRVIWREDGYGNSFKTVLQLAPRSWKFAYPFFGSTVSPGEIHMTKNCGASIAKIKRSKW